MDKKKHWYVTEIEMCVLCGREKKYRSRVYEEPQPHLKTIVTDDACGEHFM